MCWIVGSQGQVVFRSGECFGPSLAGVVMLCVGERPGCSVWCSVVCRRALGSGRMGVDGNGVADVSVCGVWVGKRFIVCVVA